MADSVLNKIAEWATDSGIKLIIAIILLIVSFKIINALTRKFAKKACEAQKLDKTLIKVMTNVIGTLAKIVVVICLTGYIGIEVTTLSALVASLGVGVGLALNGALSNFAGGFLIVLTRPFKIDDYIEACGVAGTVEDIGIVSTKIVTVDNRVIYLPNGTLSTSNIINYSEKDNRRVDLNFGVSYNNDWRKAEAVILDVCAANSQVLKDPAPFVRIIEHSSNSVKLQCRAWCSGADYWDVYFALLEDVKAAFEANGFEVPHDRIDVQVKN